MIIMTDFKFLKPLLFVGYFICSLSFFAQGQGPSEDKHLTIESTGSLEFGKFSRQIGGVITIEPSGTASSTGDIFLVNSVRSSVSFNVSTTRGNTTLVTVTASPTALTGPAGSLELSVIFDKNSFIVDKWNPATLQMGGNLSIGPEDLPGYYTGTVSVIFSYQ